MLNDNLEQQAKPSCSRISNNRDGSVEDFDSGIVNSGIFDGWNSSYDSERNEKSNWK